MRSMYSCTYPQQLVLDPVKSHNIHSDNKGKIAVNTQYLLSLTATFLLLSSPGYSAQLTVTLQSAQGKEQPLTGAAIYAQPVDVQLPAATTSAVVAQKDRQFSPYISVVQRGTQISLPNLDSVGHHVYSFSDAKRFELPLYRQQQPDPIVFDRTGLVVLGCNIHDWMVAYILVVDTPYFTVFNEHSSQLQLPPGNYHLTIWHPRLNPKESTTLLIEMAATDSQQIWRLQHPLIANQQPQEPDNFGEASY